MERRRGTTRDASALAQSLSAMSPGRAPDLWPELRAAQWAEQGASAAAEALPVLLVTGQKDGKFVAAARKMAAAAGEGLSVHSAEVRTPHWACKRSHLLTPPRCRRCCYWRAFSCVCQ